MLETLLSDFCDIITQFLHVHDVNLPFHHEVLYWIDIWWLWRPFEYRELAVVFKNQLWPMTVQSLVVTLLVINKAFPRTAAHWVLSPFRTVLFKPKKWLCGENLSDTSICGILKWPFSWYKLYIDIIIVWQSQVSYHLCIFDLWTAKTFKPQLRNLVTERFCLFMANLGLKLIKMSN